MVYFLGVKRIDGSIVKIESDSDRILTKRNFGNYDFEKNSVGWNPNRIMKIVPLEICDEKFDSFEYSSDYKYLPGNLKHILSSKRLLRTKAFKKGFEPKFSVLMCVGDGNPPVGRTGVLLYKGEPVIVDIGGKEFIVELKGVGVANGENSVTKPMRRTTLFHSRNKKWGGFEIDEGEREYKNLEVVRDRLNSFIEGDSVRAVALIKYSNSVPYDEGKSHDQAYLIRLTPTNIRATYFADSIDNKEPHWLAKCMGKQFGSLMALGLIHNTPHPENLLANGTFTDYADMRPIGEVGREKIDRIMECVNEIIGLDNADLGAYYSQITKSSGLNWDVDLLKTQSVVCRENWWHDLELECAEIEYPFSVENYFIHKFYQSYLRWVIK